MRTLYTCIMILYLPLVLLIYWHHPVYTCYSHQSYILYPA